MTTRTYDENDASNPAHYRDPDKGEAIDAMRREFGDLAVVAFCRLNAFKYRWRAGKKGPPDTDLRKAAWYDAFAAFVEGNGTDPRDLR